MSERKVVCNAGPLISLSSIHKLPLLQSLFGKVLIPEAVYSEVVLHGGSRPGQAEVENAGWIEQVSVNPTAAFKLVLDKLDPGESECIALANEIQADLIILDERLARRKADLLGFSVVGTLGILLMAKKARFIETVLPLLDQLEEQSFRVSPKVRVEILRRAGE